MTPKIEPGERLWSLDALRGFDMFWIIGGDAFFQALAGITGWGWTKWGAAQLEHAEWAGFHFYDLIFPLFMFISGIAIPYSLLAKAEKGVPKGEIYRKLVKRGLLLVVLGIIYNGFLKLDFVNTRYPSVLGQIGLAYLFAAIIMLNVKTLKGRIAAVAGILGGYAIVQLLIPVPGIGAGVILYISPIDQIQPAEGSHTNHLLAKYYCRARKEVKDAFSRLPVFNPPVRRKYRQHRLAFRSNRDSIIDLRDVAVVLCFEYNCTQTGEQP